MNPPAIVTVGVGELVDANTFPATASPPGAPLPDPTNAPARFAVAELVVKQVVPEQVPFMTMFPATGEVFAKLHPEKHDPSE